MIKTVLDASALLAWLADETGADEVGRVLGAGGVLVSAVNLSEVLGKLEQRGVTDVDRRSIRNSLDIDVRAFDEEAAWSAASLSTQAREHGLSLGDRACLALALAEQARALTADRAWARIGLEADIRVIR